MEKTITRIWHGRTKAADADIYLKYVEDTGIAAYRNIKGNLSAEIWRKIEGDICHFGRLPNGILLTPLNNLPAMTMKRQDILTRM